MADPITRREFLRDATVLTAGLAISSQALSRGAEENANFRSRWDKTPDRVWLGSAYWANPLQDWRVAGGRIECVKAAPDRNVHLLTRQLGEAPGGDLRMSVRVGRGGGREWGAGAGSAGFRIGIQGPLREYRNSLIFGKGLDVGITGKGELFIGETGGAGQSRLSSTEVAALELRLKAEPADGGYKVTLSAHDPSTGNALGEIIRDLLPAERFVGNVALVANFATSGRNPRNNNRGMQAIAGVGEFWFADWQVSGTKVVANEEHAFGPILFNQYTLSGGILKMTAQMPPVGPKDSQTVRLQLQSDGVWKTIAEEAIYPEARTATFRVEKWDDRKDIPYQLAYTLGYTDGTTEECLFPGTVRRDPVDQSVLTVADVSCNAHYAFPNPDYVAKMAKLDPDLLAFTGDQFYEPSGGYGTQRAPLEPAILDLLRKWYLHGWTWRELTRDRPSVSLPDDHDVYQGNIWGESGEARHGTQEMGGYDMPPAWVNVVHRTQTSHHPDAYDPTPIKQGISVYYGPLTYGRVSFAIIADRQFKSGPEGKVPPTGSSRGDHVVDPNFDPKTADVAGLELLGDRQIKFLREWSADWRGADMKSVVSQTVFTALPTTHGPQRERLRADYDANGWPQSPRKAALREIRRAFAFHIAGDQHLPALVHYGVDTHRDAGLAFAGPTVNNLYPRWFEPEKPGTDRRPGAPDYTGDFHDSFANPVTVLAVANPKLEFRKGVLEAEQDKSSGIGLVRFDKAKRQITIECWPYLADPSQAETQFPGWPVTVDVLENYARTAAGHLPQLNITGIENPVVQVISEADKEILYTLRIAAQHWRPHVFAEGKYTVRVSDPETGKSKDLTGLLAAVNNSENLDIAL